MLENISKKIHTLTLLRINTYCVKSLDVFRQTTFFLKENKRNVSNAYYILDLYITSLSRFPHHVICTREIILKRFIDANLIILGRLLKLNISVSTCTNLRNHFIILIKSAILLSRENNFNWYAKLEVIITSCLIKAFDDLFLIISPEILILLPALHDLAIWE